MTFSLNNLQTKIHNKKKKVKTNKCVVTNYNTCLITKDYVH